MGEEDEEMKQHTEFKQTEIGIIPEDWEVKIFSDVLIGKTRSGIYKSKEFRGKGTKMINMGELFRYDRIGDCEMDLIELSTSEKERFLVKDGDLLFARRSLIAEGAGKCSLVIRNSERTFESSIIMARPNPKEANSEYLLYFFKSRTGKFLLDTILRQVAVSGITGTDLMNLKIPVPPLIEQQSIAKILSSFDSKIALNRAMNTNLELIGQALFKHWFVDFEFPNEDGKPYKSSGGDMVDSELGEVPNGWGVGTLGEFCEIIMGQSPPSTTYNEIGDGLPFYQGISDFGFRFPSRRVYCTAPTRFAEDGDVLLSVRAPVGSLNVADERCAIGRGVAALRLKGKQKGYLYYLLRATQSGWNKFEAEGTVFGSVTKSDVHDFKVILSPDALRNQFGSLVESLDKQIATNEKQSRTLAALRDALLPKLMSGKIRVPVEVNYAGYK